MTTDLGPVLKAAYPQVVATLTRVLGDMDRAMDVTQDALVTALKKWQVEGVPERPVAWLVTVGRNRAIDQFRREAKAVSLDTSAGSKVVSIVDQAAPEPQDEDVHFSDFDDDLLRLVFTCCHPVLSGPAQITLVLKVVLGLSVEEIARALLTSRASIEKRITRAKARLSEANVEFETPARNEIGRRMDAVLKAIYLLFNEGYSRLADKNLVRSRLVDEAIRLARMTCRATRHNPEPRALLALMLLSAARLPARVDSSGAFVPLAEQDRSLWDAGMIAEGAALIDAIYVARHAPGPYQIQAAISALHSKAESSESTDWLQIVALYEKLKAYDPSPVIGVNQAVALVFAKGAPGAREALDVLHELADEPVLEEYQPYYAALAFAYEATGEVAAAVNAYAKASDLAGSPAQRVYLQQRVRGLQHGVQ